jgi:hypothetical protein
VLRRVITSEDAKLLQPVAYAYTAPSDDYKTRVAKYIPAEIVAAYVAVLGILGMSSDVSASFYWKVFGTLLILTAAYTWKASMVSGLPIAVIQIVVSTVSFAIWAFALGKPFTFFDWYQPMYASVLPILYTLIPPLFIGK